MVVLPVWVSTCDRDVLPSEDGSLEEASSWSRHRPQADQVVEPRGLEHELADVDCREITADPLEYDVQPVPLRQHRVDERLGEVDPASAGLEHPLDQVLNLGPRQDDVGQLVPAVARHKDPARLVDPDLLDLRVVAAHGLPHWDRGAAATPGCGSRNF